MPTFTLDALLDELTPQLVKMDIEGSEAAAIKGADKLLKRHPPYIISELNTEGLSFFNETPESVRKTMKGYGYDAFMMYPGGDLAALVPEQSVLKPKRYNANVLFSTMEDISKLWPEVIW